MEQPKEPQNKLDVNKGGRPLMPKLDEGIKAEIEKVVQLIPVVENEQEGPGRPTVMTEVTLQKLEMSFKVGCSDREACFYANIVPATLYNYQIENPEFLEQKEVWKTRPVLKARQVVVAALENNDLYTARWYLERRDPELSDKMKVEHEITRHNIHTINIPGADELRREYERKMFELTAKALEEPKTEQLPEITQKPSETMQK